MMRGIAYCVGVGPGDPELMTCRAVRLIRENDVIVVPGKDPSQAVAYKIAAGVVPGIADKALVGIDMPMVRDRKGIDRAHRKAATLLEGILDQGKNLVYITLGDPTIYCTFSYIQRYMEADGYRVELVPGITSFCAAAARLGMPLVEWDEQLHVLPAVHRLDDALEQPGTYVLMKSGSHMAAVKEMLRRSGRAVRMAENCTMANERLYRSLEEIPDDAGYFSLIIAKENRLEEE